MSFSIPNPDQNTSKPVTTQSVLNTVVSATNINQIRGINPSGATGSGIPKQVTGLNTSVSAATAGTTSAVTVTFHRDPSDVNFDAVVVYITGYQGNPSPIQIASASESPITFVLVNTGESVSLVVQAIGNGGSAPLNTAPTAGVKLPKSAGGGFGPTASTASTFDQIGAGTNTKAALTVGSGSSLKAVGSGSITATAMPASGLTGKVSLAQGGTSVDLSASGGTTQILAQNAGHVVSARNLVAADIPSLDAAKITTGALALARGGTGVDLSASGSATAVLAQNASHVVSARSLVAADIPSLPASQITTGQIALARGGTNADLSATGGTSRVLKQVSAGASVTVGQLSAADLTDYAEGTWTPTFSNLTGTYTTTGFYIKIGKLLWIEIKISPSGGPVTSTANTTVCTNNPFSPAVDGVCFATDDAVNNYGTGWITSSSNQIWVPNFSTSFHIYIAGQYKV